MFQMLFDRAMLEAVNRLLEYAAAQAKKELEDQGHRLTGDLINTIRVEVQAKRDAILGLVWMNEYYPYLEYPLPADRVPYSRGSGRKTSKVVQALERYWQKRGLSGREALSASFATLNKWKAEGRPTKASFRFSKNGRRTGFLAATIAQIEAKADEVLSLEAESQISRAMTTAIRAAIR